jgi:hypothetical protein
VINCVVCESDVPAQRGLVQCKISELNKDSPQSNLIEVYLADFGMEHANGLTNGLTLSDVIAYEINVFA